MRNTEKIFTLLLFVGSVCALGALLHETAFAAVPNTTKLTVKVIGLRNDHGKVQVNLWSSKDGFPNNEAKAFRQTTAVVHGGTSIVVFADVPLGTYAVSSYHDENGNGRFDTRFPGIPTEGYGVSNGSRGKLGPPPYEPAQIILREPEQTVVIEIKY